MSADDDLQVLNAFVDGELDLRSRLELEARMQSDPATAARVEELEQIHGTIREGAGYHVAPTALRDRIRGATGPTPVSAPARSPRTRPAIGVWVGQRIGWRAVVAAFGFVAILAAATSVGWLRLQSDDRLLDDVVASHVRSTLGEHLVDVASSDHHTVKPWLSAKLDFSPPVDELRIPGSVFVGGRVDYLGGRPVAALVYRQGPHVVNTFVWPSATGAGQPVFAEARGYRTAHWSRHGMTHWVISDVNRAEFASVVDALRAAE